MISILVVLVIVLLIIFLNGSKESAILPDGTKLVQDKSFYDNAKGNTLNYLLSVYPTASDSFKKMSSIELAVFYNSLWYYYNCEASFKIGGVFLLAQKLANTQDGKNFLNYYFQTFDPYMVVYNCQTAKVCSPVTPCLVAGGVDNTKGIPYEFNFPLEMDFSKAVVSYQNTHNISDSGSPTYEGIKAAIDSAINITDYNMFRFGVNVLSDEPMFFMALQLGIDTIQLPCDPNSSGYFVFEIIDMRMPEKYLPKLKKRDYTDIINFIYTGESNGAMFANTWKSDFLNEGLEYMINTNIWTNRDPLDIYNDKKAKPCLEMLSKDPSFSCSNNIDQGDGFGYWYNSFIDNSLSNEYRCLNMGVDASPSPCNFFSNPTC